MIYKRDKNGSGLVIYGIGFDDIYPFYNPGRLPDGCAAK